MKSLKYKFNIILISLMILITAYLDAGDPNHELLKFAAKGDLKGVQKALKDGADVNFKTTDTWQTPLMSAVEHGQLEVMAHLIDKGANVNAVQVAGVPVLLQAFHFKQVKAARLLIKHGAKYDYDPGQGMLPLNKAFATEDPELIRWLVEDMGADPNRTGILGISPLHNAAAKGYVELAALFLEKGVDVNIRNINGVPPLQSAVNSGHKEMASWLIKKGAVINDNKDGTSDILAQAVMMDNVKMVKLLLDNGANVHYISFTGQSLLQMTKNPKIIELLKKAGLK